MDVSTHHSTSTAAHSSLAANCGNESASTNTETSRSNLYNTQTENTLSPEQSANSLSSASAMAMSHATEAISQMESLSDHPNSNTMNNTISAVYRWYDIDEDFHTKRREESSTAHCKICKKEGRVLRKSVVRFSKSVTSNLWRHLKENHPDVYNKHAKEKKTIQMHRIVSAKRLGRKRKSEIHGNYQLYSDANALSEGKAVANGEEVSNESLLHNTNFVGDGGRKFRKSGHDKYAQQFHSGYTPTFTSPRTASISKRCGVASNGGAGCYDFDHAGQGHFIQIERVRDAILSFCIYELVPHDLIRSWAFRKLIMECVIPQRSLTDTLPDTIEDQTQKVLLHLQENIDERVDTLASEINLQALEFCRANTAVHFVITEYGDEKQTSKMLTLCAVGLDHKFTPFRRCLRAKIIKGCLYSESDGYSMDLSSSFFPYMKDIFDQVRLPVQGSFSQLVYSNTVEDIQSLHSCCEKAQLTHIVTLVAALQEIILTTLHCHDAAHDDGDFCEDTLYHPAADSASGLEIRGYQSADQARDSKTMPFRKLQESSYRILGFFKFLQESTFAQEQLRNVASVEEQRYMEHELHLVKPVISNIAEIVMLLFKLTSCISASRTILGKLIAEEHDVNLLSDQAFQLIATLSTILKPFHDAIAKIRGEKCVVSSLLIPSIYTMLEKLQSQDNDTIKQEIEQELGDASALQELPAFRRKLYANLLRSFSYFFEMPNSTWSIARKKFFDFFWTATLLDPRTRPFMVKGPLSSSAFWDLIKEKAAELVLHQKSREMKDEEPAHGDALSTKREQGSENFAKSSPGVSFSAISATESLHTLVDEVWDDALQATLTSQEVKFFSTDTECYNEIGSGLSGITSIDAAKSNNLLEVEISYLKEEAHMSLRGDPLLMWRKLRQKYPLLAQLARYVLSMPSSSLIDSVSTQGSVYTSNLIKSTDAATLTGNTDTKACNAGACEAKLSASTNLRLQMLDQSWAETSLARCTKPTHGYV